MGEVYRARDPRLQRTVAIKVLPASFVTDPDRLRRFEHEARAAGSLNHPNIVAVYDVGTHEVSPYLVTEFLEGQTLRDKLLSRLSVERVLDYAAQIARGLAAAHAKGILHRDLKPENIFVAKDGCAKILDFGLAKSTASHAADGATMTSLQVDASAPGMVLGTAGYMSPEQVLGHSVDARSDIFSFGAVLYEMLSGRRAFQRESAIATMHAIVHEELPDTSDLAPRVPPSLVGIVRRCLARESDGRFQSASDLAFALSALSQSQIGTTASSGAMKPGANRRRITGALACAVATAACGAAGYWTAGWRAIGAPPTFRQLTFRRGAVYGARFSPDGNTMIYDANWDGTPMQVFSLRMDTAESTALPMPEARILAVSKSGELAILKTEAGGTLARVPLGGSGMRDVAESVVDADWAPDGATLVVIRREAPGHRLEYPIGKIVFRPAEGDRLASPRVSPDGELVAVIELDAAGQGSLTLVDRSGVVKRRSRRRNIAWYGVAWRPDGREVWFNASETGLEFAVHAMTVDGRERVVLGSMGAATVSDIARDGRALMVHDRARGGMISVRQNETRERDLSWLDYSRPQDLSNDGKVVLFTESGVGAGASPAVYVRSTDGSPAVRLGEGSAWALSPDGKWALATRTGPSQMVLLPTGVGQTRVLETGTLTSFDNGRWSPDGTRVVFNARAPGRSPRVYMQNVLSGGPTPITPEGVQMLGGSVSPDSKQVLAAGPGPSFALYPLGGGAPVTANGFDAGDDPVRWSGDGKSIWSVNQTSGVPRIMRIDVATGRRDVWREIEYADPSGLLPGQLRVVMSADGRSYVYGYLRSLSDLYVADGLR